MGFYNKAGLLVLVFLLSFLFKCKHPHSSEILHEADSLFSMTMNIHEMITSPEVQRLNDLHNEAQKGIVCLLYNLPC